MAAKLVLFLSPAVFSPSEMTALIAIGTLAGEAPDVDLLFFYFNQKYGHASKKKESHRSYTTHAPAFWLLVSLFIVGAGSLADSGFTVMLGWLILAGTWSHFLLDSIEYGIRWLWPFSNRRLCLRQVVEVEIDAPKGTLRFYRKELTAVYFKNVTFYLEIAIVLAALWVAFH